MWKWEGSRYLQDLIGACVLKDLRSSEAVSSKIKDLPKPPNSAICGCPEVFFAPHSQHPAPISPLLCVYPNDASTNPGLTLPCRSGAMMITKSILRPTVEGRAVPRSCNIDSVKLAPYSPVLLEYLFRSPPPA